MKETKKINKLKKKGGGAYPAPSVFLNPSALQCFWEDLIFYEEN